MIHVLTPFSRTYLLPQLLEDYKRLPVKWHPLCHEKVEFPDWVEPFYIPIPDKFFDLCYYKLNKGLDILHEKYPNDFVMFMCDDDLITEVPTLDADIIFLTVNLGDYPVGVHGIGITYPTWKNMSPGSHLENSICRLSKIKGVRFRNDDHHADGVWNDTVKRIPMAKIKYCPDIVVKFNWYEKGRWRQHGDRHV